MGSKGERARKAHEHLPKVPKYEEPNTFPAAGIGGGAGVHAGRAGHSADHHETKPPGPFGRFVLKVLGKRPAEPPTP